MLRQPNTKQNWTILSSLYDAVKQTELKKLRLAKYSECGRATPYRLKSLQITTVPCKRFGTPSKDVRS